MNVPVSWLREYVAFDLPVKELARRLVFTSCEVDRVVTRGVPDSDGNLELFLVGKVLEAEKHPNADRLQLCRVDVGAGDPREIVCGAWNFGAGATVAVALPGAMLPNGLELERREVRGELSDGMILARTKSTWERITRGSWFSRKRSRGRRSATCCRSSTTYSSSSRP